MQEEFLEEIIREVLNVMDENSKKLKTCLDELDETDIWKHPNQHSNSIGNLVLHLSGNIRQWIISSLGNIEDSRDRDQEFSADGGYSKSQLAEKLFSTVEDAKNIIRNISVEDVLKKRKVQGTMVSGIAAIIHVAEHYSYHTGQVIFWTKLVKDIDLGFYSSANLNAKNE
jgi:uncharacterized damage-inducible protein DinB